MDNSVRKACVYQFQGLTLLTSPHFPFNPEVVSGSNSDLSNNGVASRLRNSRNQRVGRGKLMAVYILAEDYQCWISTYIFKKLLKLRKNIFKKCHPVAFWLLCGRWNEDFI